MANQGCNNCNQYQHGVLQMWKPDEPHKCKLGKDAEFNAWWNENGRKTNRDEITDMPCFEETGLGLMCKDLKNVLDKLGEVIDKQVNPSQL